MNEMPPIPDIEDWDTEHDLTPAVERALADGFDASVNAEAAVRKAKEAVEYLCQCVASGLRVETGGSVDADELCPFQEDARAMEDLADRLNNWPSTAKPKPEPATPRTPFGITEAVNRAMAAAQAASQAAFSDPVEPQITDYQRRELEAFMCTPATRARLRNAAAILLEVQSGACRATDYWEGNTHRHGVGHDGIERMLEWML